MLQPISNIHTVYQYIIHQDRQPLIHKTKVKNNFIKLSGPLHPKSITILELIRFGLNITDVAFCYL